MFGEFWDRLTTGLKRANGGGSVSRGEAVAAAHALLRKFAH